MTAFKMPQIDNPRHEKFCQLIAQGKNGREAYLGAGYDCSEEAADVGASRLLTKDKVAARVREIQGKAAIRTELTVHGLLQDAERIMQGAIADSQWAAANGALQTRAKLAGLWVDKKEVGGPGDFDRMSDGELRDHLRAEMSDPAVQAALRERGNGQAH